MKEAGWYGLEMHCSRWRQLDSSFVPLTSLKCHPSTPQEVIKSIQNVLQTNVSVCTSLGQPFVSQFNVVFGDMLQVGQHTRFYKFETKDGGMGPSIALHGQFLDPWNRPW